MTVKIYFQKEYRESAHWVGHGIGKDEADGGFVYSYFSETPLYRKGEAKDIIVSKAGKDPIGYMNDLYSACEDGFDSALEADALIESTVKECFVAVEKEEAIETKDISKLYPIHQNANLVMVSSIPVLSLPY